jgi:hypothetical protein
VDLPFSGVPSYTNFGHYVLSVDSNLHAMFEDYFSFDGNWADFENTLAHLDAERILDEAFDYLVPYSAEDWSDAYHHDYQYEVNRIVTALSHDLKGRFTEWVCGLGIPDSSSCQVPLLKLKSEAAYLPFNYTDTLHKLYGVSQDQITYIHNQAIDCNSELVLGHGISPSAIPSLNSGDNLDDQDVRVIEANKIIDRYFSETYKPSQEVISAHMQFFNSLSEAECICVLGHSLSEVDWPYFSLIAQKTLASSPKWVVSYRDDAKISGMIEVLTQFGILASNVEFRSITNACHET